jgi:putative transcriptional regulator
MPELRYYEDMAILEVLTNHFLIAMPGLEDGHFSRTVTYICEHSADGALGIVINRALDEVRLVEVLESMSIHNHDPWLDSQSVFWGGPVDLGKGFVLHSPPGQWHATVGVGEQIGLTTSRDVLQAMAEGRGPRQSMVAFGYAGWAAGQLEHEISENWWLHGPADPRVLFEVPNDERWAAAAGLLGVDLVSLSGNVGHA